jgi:phosphoribosylanthranilate isomerase
VRSVRVKMCGLARPEDVRNAVRLGADFLGFVLAPGGPRSLSAAGAERLLADAETGAAQRVGVFRDQSARFVNEMVARCGLHLVQLHGHEPRDYPSAVSVPVVRVLRVRSKEVPVAAGESLRQETVVGERLRLPPNVTALLIDAEDSTGRSGGLGLAPDDAALRAALQGLPPKVHIFLSGGLTPENVAARIRDFQPWAVDVSSGIESAPGVKDERRMAAFLAALEASS